MSAPRPPQTPATDPRQETRQLLRLLAQPRAVSPAREDAARVLRGMGGEAMLDLLSVASDNARRAKWRRRCYNVCVAGAIPTMLAGYATMPARVGPISLGALLLPGSVGLLILGAVTAPPDDFLGELIARMGGAHPAHLAGPVAEALELPDVRWIAEELLIRLLPALRASDAGMLNAEQRAALYRSLRRGRPEYVLVALKALEQIADEQAVPHVQRLAERPARTARQKRIRQAAQECLPMVAARARVERGRRMLVRPADAPTDRLLRDAAPPTDVMLRPALHVATPSDRMLQPHPRAGDEP